MQTFGVRVIGWATAEWADRLAQGQGEQAAPVAVPQ